MTDQDMLMELEATRDALSEAKSYRRRIVKDLRAELVSVREECVKQTRRLRANFQEKHDALWDRFVRLQDLHK